MKFRLDQYARNFYGDKDYTIAEGILSGKGKLVVRNNLWTKWKNEYLYRLGGADFSKMEVNGQNCAPVKKEKRNNEEKHYTDEAKPSPSKNKDVITDFERAIEEARHYILMDTDTFAIRIGDITIRRDK